MFSRNNSLYQSIYQVLAGIGIFLFALSTAQAAETGLFPQELRIAAVGDMMLDGTARPEYEKFGYDYAFDSTRELLKKSHIVFGNLEGPLTLGGQAEKNKKYIFRSPPFKVAKALQHARFDVVSLANNHSLDYGSEGLQQTIDTLAQFGIRHVGAGENLSAARAPAIVVVGNRIIAFLAYSLTFPQNFWATSKRPGTAFGHEAYIIKDIQSLKGVADSILVSFHWGQEGKTTLREYQSRLGRAAIDAGADAVIGHHPHILQGVEHYKNGVILYSLGNYTFGSYSQRARHSVIAQLVFHGPRLSEVRLLPINVLNVDVIFQPRPLQGKEADSVITELQQLSAMQGTRLENINGVAVLKLNNRLAQP